MLSGGVSLAERTRVQGLADALIWSTAAIASLGSGVVVGRGRLHGARDPGRGARHRARVRDRLARRTHRSTIARRPVRAGRRLAGRADAAARQLQLLHDPRREHPGALLDLGRAARARRRCGRRRTSPGPKITHRRAALVDEQPHVRAVRLAEQRRPAAGHRLGGIGERRPAAGDRTARAPTRTARR